MQVVFQFIEIIARSVALLLFASLSVRAIFDFDVSWDSNDYHLPFAARLVGLIPKEHLTFLPLQERAYSGFPVLGEFIQGLLWRLSGRIESANLVGLFALSGYAYFLKKLLAVPYHASILALLAVPMIHLHVTTCYVDLLANLSLSALVVITLLVLSGLRNYDFSALSITLFSSAVALNTKYMVYPMTFLCLGVQIIFVLYSISTKSNRLTISARQALLIAIFSLPILFATLFKNIIININIFRRDYNLIVYVWSVSEASTV